MRHKKGRFAIIAVVFLSILALMMLDGKESSTEVPEPEVTLVEETRRFTKKSHQPQPKLNEERAPEEGWPQYDVRGIHSYPKPEDWGCEHLDVVRRDGYYYVKWCDGEAGPCDSFKHLSGGPRYYDEKMIEPVTYICIRGQKEIFGIGEREGRPYDAIEHFIGGGGNAVFAGKRGSDWYPVRNFDEGEAYSYVSGITLVDNEPVYAASDGEHYRVYWSGETSPPYDEVILTGESATTYSENGELVWADPAVPSFTAYVDGERRFLSWREWLAQEEE